MSTVNTVNQRIKLFDPLTVPILGSNLIEASAGTGKTWSIAALYLRLLLEEKLKVEQILVVTYTKAATAELKSRLRARLNEALFALEHKDCLHDDYLQALFKRLTTEPQNTLILRLKAAISQFDHAAIYTIHGFCQRILKDHAFLAASPFEVELVSDANAVIQTLNEDFWRLHISNHSVWAKLVFERQLTPATLLRGIKNGLSKPYLVYQLPSSYLKEASKHLNAVWAKVDANWLQAAQHHFWQEYPNLNRVKYRQNTFEQVFSALNTAQERGKPDILAPYLDKITQLLPTALAENTKAKLSFSESHIFAPIEPIIQALIDYKTAQDTEFIILKFSLLNYLNQTLHTYNQEQKQLRFDDLLLGLANALHGEQGSMLAKHIAQTWQVALIDEFQDTDPLQYQIFKQSFIDQQNPIFLVGDPKQAIYSFRGADIFTYLNASLEVQHHYTLSTNYRSHKRLLDGVSKLFTQHPRPFLFEHIAYNEVHWHRLESALEPKDAALHIQWLNQAGEGQLNKDLARNRAADYCASSIVAQLNLAQTKTLKLKDRPLNAGDIAILVSTHNQGKLIAAALKAQNIDSVSLSQESVFASAEAQALYSLLNLWLNPNHTGLLRLVLSSLFFGYGAKEIFALDQNEALLLKLIDQAVLHQRIWQQQGIFAAFAKFAQATALNQRLLQRQKERSLSNLTQLLELLATEEPKHFGTHASLQWLAKKIQAALAGEKIEEAQLRLESDENLVKIITIHTAKGLQYPIVYCPFLWDGKNKEIDELNRLNQDATSQLIAKEQLSSSNKIQLEDENLAEQLRLLYVALTRAEEALYLSFGETNQLEKSALSFLLFGQNFKHAQDFQTYLKSINGKKGTMTLAEFLQQNIAHVLKQNIVCNMEAPIIHALLTVPATSTHYQAKKFSGSIKAIQRNASFSSLTYSQYGQYRKNISLDDIAPQLDPIETLQDDDGAASLLQTVFSFPKGTRPGLCLHELLENFDFNTSVTEQTHLAMILDRYGFDKNWFPPICGLLQNTQKALLNPGITLETTASKQRLDEMGFVFDAHHFNTARLYQTLSNPILGLPASCIQAAKTLDFMEIDGFLNGFIDLICQDKNQTIYVIDYKSNHLGNQLMDYLPENLDTAMAEHHYYLQAALYAIATYRYFKTRNQRPPKLAIRYLFLRGLEESSMNGVWAWDLGAEALELLNRTVQDQI